MSPYNNAAAKAPHFLYRCYDADDVLLYIGCTANPPKRIAAHRRGDGTSLASRWLSVFMARHEVEGPFADRDAGREAERQAIRAEQPLFNYQERKGPGWITRRPIARYLIEQGHLALALETVCACWTETREAGAFDDFCIPHVAAHAQAGAA